MDAPRLPTGAHLDPVGMSHEVGPYPFTMIAMPEHDRVVLMLAGYRRRAAFQVVETTSGKVLQTLTQPAAFVGLAFDSAGRHLSPSGGNRDLVYVYAWEHGATTLSDSIVLEKHTPREKGDAISGRDGRFDRTTSYNFVAENLTRHARRD